MFKTPLAPPPNPMVRVSDAIARIVDSDLQACEKIDRLSKLIQRESEGASAAAFHIVMQAVRK